MYGTMGRIESYWRIVEATLTHETGVKGGKSGSTSFAGDFATIFQYGQSDSMVRFFTSTIITASTVETCWGE